jgi:hypothetical protein
MAINFPEKTQIIHKYLEILIRTKPQTMAMDHMVLTIVMLLLYFVLSISLFVIALICLRLKPIQLVRHSLKSFLHGFYIFYSEESWIFFKLLFLTLKSKSGNLAG